MTPPRQTRAPARPYRKPVVRGEATAQQVRSMYAVMSEPRPEPEPVPEFRGDTATLIRCIDALLALDAKGVLVPHGIGGHARTLLAAAAARLAAAEPGLLP